ncbi:hypothetical protein SO694_00167037 [Aureococcus anophagefferens]|uniref:Uncharacterized protein n=1 Tax=Aureococcus anophagefferens TaxID=44056 RepID=A0ABR1G6B2_AURAN
MPEEHAADGFENDDAARADAAAPTRRPRFAGSEATATKSPHPPRAQREENFDFVAGQSVETTLENRDGGLARSYNATCDALRDADFQRRLGDRVPAVAAARRVYDVAVEVNAAQRAELAACPKKPAAEKPAAKKPAGGARKRRPLPYDAQGKPAAKKPAAKKPAAKKPAAKKPAAKKPAAKSPRPRSPRPRSPRPMLGT